MGHTHTAELWHTGAFPVYIDGGKRNLFSYVGSEILLDSNHVEIRAVKNDGTVVLSKNLQLNDR